MVIWSFLKRLIPNHTNPAVAAVNRMNKKIDNKLPVIAVIGASGVGKSKLAIDLALSLNGECINADAMQVYKGLDISTNKVRFYQLFILSGIN